MNFVELLRTPVLQNTSGWLLLDRIKEEKGIMEFLDSRASGGRWTLDAGLWTHDPGCWILDARVRTLNSGRWTLDTGYWVLDSGHWILDTGLWTLKFYILQSFGSNEAMEIYQINNVFLQFFIDEKSSSFQVWKFIYNPFHANILFLYPPKMSEKLWIFDIFRV